MFKFAMSVLFVAIFTSCLYALDYHLPMQHTPPIHGITLTGFGDMSGKGPFLLEAEGITPGSNVATVLITAYSPDMWNAYIPGFSVELLQANVYNYYYILDISTGLVVDSGTINFTK